MKYLKTAAIAAVLLNCFFYGNAFATSRNFTYTYEPETMLRGDLEFEQWVTYRGSRNSEVGQEDFSRWDVREEIEYGVTDGYTLALYLNTKGQYFKNPQSGAKTSDFDFNGVSIENKFMLQNPTDRQIGLSLYIEPTFSEDEIELEEKIIIGQRVGDWKWALNFTHETEWEENETTGVFEVTFGLIRELDKRWRLGFEFRTEHEIEDYKEWIDSVYFLGPVVSYHRENWWVALTALAQVYGQNHGVDQDGESDLVLDRHEYLNVRCIVGIDF